MNNRNFWKLIVSVLMMALVSCHDEDTETGPALNCTSSDTELVCPSGSEGYFKAHVTSRYGLKTIYVTLGKWTESGTETQETIEIYGSPKFYDLSYTFQVPDDAALDNQLKVSFLDYAGNQTDFTAAITVETDQTAPVIEILKPVAPDNVFAPVEVIQFEASAIDNKKMRDVVLACEAIGFSETFTPGTDRTQVRVKTSVNIPDEGEYEFLLTATDAQGNQETSVIPVTVEVGSKPAIVNKMERIAGVAGGTMPFRFEVSTNSEHTITSITVETSEEGCTARKTVEANEQIYLFEDALEIPQTAAPHADDLVITVTALNDIGEQSVWTGTATVIKGVYIYGNATVSKSNKEYSMPMVQTPSSNEFTFKTYVEAAGDGFLLWTGDYTEDSDHFRTVNAFIDWGKQDGTTVSSASSEPITISQTGYYDIRFNPLTLEYSVEPDRNVPSETIDTGEVWAQMNNQLYYNGSQWLKAAWTFVRFEDFPGVKNRYYIDVKIEGTGWNRGFFGLTAQSGDNGVLYSLLPFTNWFYANNAYASYLDRAPDWNTNSKFEEKGNLPDGTKMRCVVDTYLMQVGWAPLTQYKYPETPTPDM